MQEWDAEDVKMERELELHQRMQLEAAKQAALKAQVSALVNQAEPSSSPEG